jgi:ATP-dependent Clp protease adaptor protein ClpS
MLQVESMRGAMRLTRTRPGIEVAAGVSRWNAPGIPALFPRAHMRGDANPDSSSRRKPVEVYRQTAGLIHALTRAATLMAETPDTRTLPDIDVEEKLKAAFARGWSVIVWNDPVNLMDYVVYVFKIVLKMNEKEASKHMWEVHQKGKSMVAIETREKSELIVHRLRGFGLNATMEQA